MDQQYLPKMASPARPLKSVLSKEHLQDLHTHQNKSQREIAEIYGTTARAVISLRKQYGIPLNRQARPTYQRHVGTSGSLGSVAPEDVSQLYHGESLSLQKIADRFGVTRPAVMYYMQKHGIALRSKSDARRTAVKSGRLDAAFHDIDVDFFKQWSPTMAWVLGLIFTDGCISGSFSVSISSVDLDLLEQVKHAIKSSHPIRLVNQTLGGTIYCFSFGRKEIVRDLARYGICPRKSLIIQFPVVPDRFKSHFIRGLFDGDGSVFMTNYANVLANVSYVSGSYDFIWVLENELRSNCGLTARTIGKTHSGEAYTIKYGHRDSINFFKYIYRGSTIENRLSRKYNKFLEIFQLSGMQEEEITRIVSTLPTTPNIQSI